MARILVLYGTTDGHTGKIASFVADQLRARGPHVELVEAGRADTPDPSRYDGVIVAAPIHVSAYQPAVRRWVAAQRADGRHRNDPYCSSSRSPSRAAVSA